MDFAYTKEQQLLLDETGVFLRKYVDHIVKIFNCYLRLFQHIIMASNEIIFINFKCYMCRIIV